MLRLAHRSILRDSGIERQPTFRTFNISENVPAWTNLLNFADAPSSLKADAAISRESS